MYFPFNCLQWTQAACNSATPISQAYEGECVYEGEGILKTNTNIYCCTNLFSTECPTEQPEFGSACSLPQFAKCSYGEECCCGQCHPRFIWTLWTKFWSMLIQMPPQVGISSTKNVNCYFFPSLMMMCSGGSVEASSNASGSWTGYNTDVCMRPDCGTTTGNVLKPKYILIKMTKCCDATVASQMKRTYIPQQWNVATQQISKFRFISTNITWKELIISSCGYVTGFLMISIRVILFISRYS